MHSFFHDEPTAAAFDNLIVDTVYPTEPRCLEPIIDEFDGECVDGRYLVQTTYGSPRERDGHLELIRESVVSGEIGLTLDPTRHMLCGDFDVQVRYRLDEYAAPRAGERTFALRIRSARAERLVAAVERGVSAHPRGDIGVDWFRTQHEGRSASRYHDAERSSGALRIVRTDGVVTLMSLEKDEWRTLSFAAVSDEPLYYEIMLGCSDDETRSVVRCDRLIVNTSVNGDPLNGDRELKGQ